MDCLITKPVRTTSPTPAQEPVSLTEAKHQCGLAESLSYFDNDLQGIIRAAREAVEHDTGLVCYTGEHIYKFTDWPCERWFEIPGVRPVTAVTSIVYLDANGASTTWASSNYVLDTYTVIPTVRLAYNIDWPAVLGDVNGITVTFSAGYASVVAIPPGAKDLVLTDIGRRWQRQHGNDTKYWDQCYDRQVMQLMRGSYP